MQWRSDFVLQVRERDFVGVQRCRTRRDGIRRRRRRGRGCGSSKIFLVVDDDLVGVARRLHDFVRDGLLDRVRLAMHDARLEARVEVRGEPPCGLELQEQALQWRGAEAAHYDVRAQERLAA